MFKDKDIIQFKTRGMDPAEVERQVSYFKKGFPYMKLVKAATIGHGIVKLSEKQLKDYTALYERAADTDRIKFVPASGAASRMFKALFEFDESFKQANYDSRTLSKDAYKHVKEFFERIDEFAFRDDLDKVLKKAGKSIPELIKRNEYHVILEGLLNPGGLNYGSLPKGLLKFHHYGNDRRTAVEEHLVEGAGYAVNQGGKVKIHLTVSPEHQKGFEDLMKRKITEYEAAYKVTFDLSFSVQKASTDTVAVDMNNEPFRDKDGSVHFRPGGHGALLENLNDLDDELVFIKNIDNVVPDELKSDTLIYKKALAGMLLSYRQRIFDYLKQLDSGDVIAEDRLREMKEFLSNELCTQLSNRQLSDTQKTKDLLYAKLNRPIRVCGMVKNEGEPGGGPFWTKNRDDSVSLQIVETSQIDHHHPEQEAILNSSSHFNPVDLICSIKDYKGAKFKLLKYRDPETGFISRKFRNGKPLKALELPGLWNGSMSDWNTIFVEVPVTTFNPVKTFSDLLRPEHKGKATK